MDKKSKARQLVKSAVRRGTLPRASEFPCSNCGTNREVNPKVILEYHHSDYDKPMDVVVLCRKCHIHRHMEEDPDFMYQKNVASGNLAKALAKRWQDPAQREALAKANSERVISEETRQKMSQSAYKRHSSK